MNRLLLITSDEGVLAQVTRVSGGDLDVLPSSALTDGPLITQALASHPRALVIDATSDPEGALALTEHVSQQIGAAVILVARPDSGLAVRALRSGVVDIIDPEGPPEEYEAALSRASRQAPPTHAQPSGGHQSQVITVASPKGGVGKTTVSTNLAVGLAQLAPESTVLVDLDLHFGDVASALNLQPEYSLPDTTRAAAIGDALAVKSFLTRHESGLFVVPGSDSPASADAVTSQDVHNLLALLGEAFTYVVVDTAPGLTEHTLAAFDNSSQQVFVSSMDVPGIRGLRKELETLKELGMLLEPRHIVINFADPARGLSLGDVEATLGVPVDLALLPTNLVPISVNQGVPLLHNPGGRDKTTKTLRQLVRLVSGQPEQAERRGLFGGRR